MDYLGITYVGKQHTLHLLIILEQHYEITYYWEGKIFAGIDLEWNYTEQNPKRTCHISINGYIDKLLIRYEYPQPHKLQLSPYKHPEVTYGTEEQPTPEEKTSPALDNEGTKRIQGIIGTLLYYAIAGDNKLLVGLISIGAQQAATTQRTNEATNQLLDYSATQPTDGILYRSSDMVLFAHSGAGFRSERKVRSRAGVQNFLSENDPMLKWNCPVLTLAQIIIFFMFYASEAELGAIFITFQ